MGFMTITYDRVPTACMLVFLADAVLSRQQCAAVTSRHTRELAAA